MTCPLKRSSFTEEQISTILRAETGVATAEVRRRHGVSSATFYKWNAKFGGLDVSQAKRLKALEDEDGRLKPTLAAAMLDNAALKDLLGKTWWRPPPDEGLRAASAGGLRDERAVGVPDARDRPDQPALPGHGGR